MKRKNGKSFTAILATIIVENQLKKAFLSEERFNVKNYWSVSEIKYVKVD